MKSGQTRMSAVFNSVLHANTVSMNIKDIKIGKEIKLLLVNNMMANIENPK